MCIQFVSVSNVGREQEAKSGKSASVISSTTGLKKKAKDTWKKTANVQAVVASEVFSWGSDQKG